MNGSEDRVGNNIVTQELYALLLDLSKIKDEETAQTQLADPLRKKAIEHLGTSGDVCARSFRGEFIFTKDPDALDYNHEAHKDFLKQQAEPKCWATDLEAMALAEHYGFTLVVTDKSTNIAEPIPQVLYKAKNDNAMVLNLIFKNDHWSFKNNTAGDGNCLYYALIQALYAESKVLAPRPQSGLFNNDQNYKNDMKLLKEQHEAVKEWQDQIDAAPKPIEVEQQLEAEKLRISTLPVAEQQQIAADYQLAIKLAMEDFDSYKDYSATVNSVAAKLIPTSSRKQIENFNETSAPIAAF